MTEATGISTSEVRGASSVNSVIRKGRISISCKMEPGTRENVDDDVVPLQQRHLDEDSDDEDGYAVDEYGSDEDDEDSEDEVSTQEVSFLRWAPQAVVLSQHAHATLEGHHW